MNILLAAATTGEIVPTEAYLRQHWNLQPNGMYQRDGRQIRLVITGVGMVAATWAITRAACSQSFDFALLVGVAGSFDAVLPPGELVMVSSERYGDLGAEDHDAHLDIFDMGLLAANDAPFVDGSLPLLPSPLHGKINLPQASSLSVNMVSGNAATIERLRRRYGCQIENMEGAAFHYVCLQEKLPFAQIRAISNYITPRDKTAWNMPLAIANLNGWLVQFLDKSI